MLRSRDEGLQNRYFVNDYDLKQHVKAFFCQNTGCFVFLEYTQDCLGRSDYYHRFFQAIMGRRRKEIKKTLPVLYVFFLDMNREF